jgi:molybdate transport system substrate-binding protein
MLLLACLLAVATPAKNAKNWAKVICNSASRGAIEELKPWISARAHVHLECQCGSTAEGVERLNNGEAADVAVLTKKAVRALARQGMVRTQKDFARSDVGIAIADGAPRPVMKSTEDFSSFLQTTPSIGYTTGASGKHLARIISMLGLDEVMKPKSIVVDGGGAAKLLSSGKVAAAVQQISELRADGAQNIVPLPESVQMHTILTIAVLNGARDANKATEILRALTSTRAIPIYQRWGLVPLYR